MKVSGWALGPLVALVQTMAAAAAGASELPAGPDGHELRLRACVDQMVADPEFRNVAKVVRLTRSWAARGLPDAGSYVVLSRAEIGEGRHRLFLRPMRNGWTERLLSRDIHVHGAQILALEFGDAEYSELVGSMAALGDVSLAFAQRSKSYPVKLPADALLPGMVVRTERSFAVVVRKVMVPRVEGARESDKRTETYDPNQFYLIVLPFAEVPRPGDASVAVRLHVSDWGRGLGRTVASTAFEVIGEGEFAVLEKNGANAAITGRFLNFVGNELESLGEPPAPIEGHVKSIRLVEFAKRPEPE